MSQSCITNAKGEVIGAKLTITGATYENTGSYECRVSNSHGEDKGIAQIMSRKCLISGLARMSRKTITYKVRRSVYLFVCSCRAAATVQCYC